MAEANEKVTENEAEALERLLGEEAQKEEETVQEEEVSKGKNRKLLLIVGGSVLLILAGVAAFVLLGGEEEEVPNLEEIAKPVEKPKEEKKTEQPLADVPNFYALEPFFLPITEKGEETGQFVHIRINLQMSNKKLSEEIESVLPLVRQNIYEILARKRPRDFKNPKKPIKERLKSEIVASTNTLLVTGSGKIEDVFFAEFVIR